MAGILVLAEHRRGELRPGTAEAIGAASALKAEIGGPLAVLAIASDPQKYVSQLALGGIDEVIAVTVPAEEFEPHIYQAALRAAIEARSPSLVLLAHSVDAWSVAPALAAALGLGFATDVLAVRGESGQPVATRAAYKEKVLAEVEFPGRSTVLLTLRSGAFPAATAASAPPAVSTLDVPGAIAHSTHLGWREPPSAGGIDIPGSELIVSIGRGVGDEANVEQFLELADSLGATLGCSRPIADNGWLPKARQVGQSGQLAAKCKVYVAMGISGSVQHQWGMKHVETIIAVNKDPEASIFGIAKYGVVGDMLEIADEMRKQLG